jgi:hypothetical protein
MTRRKVLAPLGILVAVVAVVLGVTFGVHRDSKLTALAGATDAQLVVRTADNNLLHAIRSNADRTWSEAGDLLGQTGRPTGTITHIASTVINGELNIVASDAFGVYLAVRYVDGNWAGLQRIATCANVTSLAVAAVRSELQVLVATDGGAGLYHAVRHSDGTWTSFGDVKAVAGGLTGTITQVAAAGVNGQLQAVALAGGKVRHAVRDAGGTWTSFGDVLASNDPNHVVGTPSGVAVGAAGNMLHLLVQGGNGTTLWHMIRRSGGNWSLPEDAMKAMGHKATLVSVAAAGVNGDLQVAMVDNSGAVWHTIRHSAGGTWDRAGQLTPAIVPGMPSDVVETAIAGS